MAGAQGTGAPAPGRGSQLAGVSETLAGLAQDAFSIFDAALRSAQRPPSRPAEPARPPWASATAETATETGTGTGWPGPSPEQAAPSEPDVSAPPGAPVDDAAPVAAGASSDDGPVVGSPVFGGAAVHPQDQDGESAHERGDREERGEAGDGPAGDGRDDQVERPAE